MYPTLLHIYGPLQINSFNAAIMAGIALFFYAAFRHPGSEKWVRKSDFFNTCIESGIAGIIGGRLLHVLSQWHDYESFYDMLALWNGGLSILGALAGVLIYSVWSLRRKQLPILPIYDIAAVYVPLAQGMGRIGCFLVGCCYGCPTSLFWGVTYTHPLAVAPLHIQIHPTQLYSSLIFFGIFLFMRFFAFPRARRPGELSMLYLMAMSFERWFIDFFRGDRIMLSGHYSFSFHQWVAFFIFVGAGILYFFIRLGRRSHEPV